MVLDMFRYEGVEVVVSYFPVWEMFFSMHVLSNPEHHLTRRKWVEAKEKSYPDLIKEIRDLGEVTDSWILIIDSEKWSEIRQMEIVEMLHFFRNKNIYQWNEWVKRSVGKEMSVKERNRILDIVEKYYKCVFKNEEMILRPYLVRILQKEKEKCLKEGLWNWCGNVHSRLKIKQDTIVYKKNQEYGFEKKALNKIFITASTFVHPHTLFVIMSLVCGITFPIQYLPEWVQRAAQIFPLTPAVALFRNVAIGHQNLAENYLQILQVLVLSFVYLVIGAAWYISMERNLVENIFG